MPSPRDSFSASVPTSPFLVLRSRRQRSTTRASAKDAPRVFAVSRASAVHSCMSPTAAETISAGTTFFEFDERGTAAGLRRAFGPGGQVVLLFGSEFIDENSHRFQLELGDLPVDRLRNVIDFALHLRCILHHIFGGHRLIRKAH